MGVFGVTVSTLLESFSNGLAVIKRLQRHRKDKKTQISASVKAEEERLDSSLRTNRREIKSVYDRYAQAKLFAAGDAESEASLASILFALNLAFMSIIDAFVKGESTQSDYRVLLNLSNSSKFEAIRTFEQLQCRVSRSTLPRENEEVFEHRGRRNHGKKAARRTSRSHHSNPSSADSPKKASSTDHPKTDVGPAAIPGRWARTKETRVKAAKKSKKSSKLTSSTPKISMPETPPAPQRRNNVPNAEAVTKTRRLPRPPQPDPAPIVDTPDSQRFSILSIATTSTRIGEIPEHKWAQPTFSKIDGLRTYDAKAVFPLAPYVEPEKPRSKLVKLFRLGRG